MEKKNLQQRQELYLTLCDESYSSYPYASKDLGENMEMIEQVMWQYWKPRYLINHNTKTAVEFINDGEYLTTVSEDDILWGTLSGLSGKGIERARNLYAHYPTHICSFSNGVAEVSWQINPEGMYFMDEDGYGMTDDEEETLYGFIDCQGRVVSKFRNISNLGELEIMKQEAIIYSRRNID